MLHIFCGGWVAIILKMKALIISEWFDAQSMQ